MGFRFPLATVLRVREIAEEREERLLKQILEQITLSQQSLAELEAQRRALRQRQESAWLRSTSATEIAASYDQIRRLRDLEASAREHLEKLLLLREQQMAIYKTAHQSRELLSTIRNERLEQYRTTQERREQSAIDDAFSSRRRRS